MNVVNMALLLSSIVSCAQCPTCRTYVPIPPALLSSLTAPVPIPVPAAPVPAITPGPQYPPYSSFNPPVPPGPMKPLPPRTDTNAPVYALSKYENSWRSKFLKIPVAIHGAVQLVLTVLIIILEIASLATSSYLATGAGIWCSIPFMTAAILTNMLVWKWDRSRVWATRVFIAEIVLIVFSFILIGIVGSFVSAGAYVYSTYSSSSINYLTYGNNYSTKYAIMQAQLAFGILLLFSGVAYIVFYCVVTYLALWKPFQTLDTPHLLRN